MRDAYFNEVTQTVYNEISNLGQCHLLNVHLKSVTDFAQVQQTQGLLDGHF